MAAPSKDDDLAELGPFCSFAGTEDDAMIVYLNGEFKPLSETSISPNDRGFLFADGVYEVIRWYGGFWFQAPAHWKRLRTCLAAMHIQMEDDNDEDDWEAVANELIQRNHLTDADAHVYLQVTRGVAPRSHAFPNKNVLQPTIYGFARANKNLPHLQQSGCKVITAPDQRWLRCDIKSISLLPNVLAKQAAVEAKVFETVLVRDGNITEGSSTCFVAIMNNQLVTAPLKGNLILPSITRHVVLELCRDELGIVVMEDFLAVTRAMEEMDEAMILSTTSEVIPVVEMDGKPIGNGKPGPVTRRIQQAFRQKVALEKSMVASQQGVKDCSC